MPDTQSLPAMVRAKYPGIYDDLSDVELDAKVRAKYPGVYDDMASPKVAQSNVPGMSAALPDSAYSPTGPLPRGVTPKAREFLDTPLAHTGIDAVDSMTSPGNIAVTATMLGLGAAKAAALPTTNVILKAKAALSAVAESAAPAIKYEVVKHSLMAAHVPESIATVVAMGVAGYKKGAQAPAAETPAAPARGPRQPPREPGPIPEGIGRPKGESTLEVTRRLKAENQAKYAAAVPAAAAAPTPAPAASVPAESAPVPSTAPPATASEVWKGLRAAGLKPTEATEAARLLGQGMAPEAVQAKILGARPQPASVAPTPGPEQINPPSVSSGAMSPARTLNELAIAARRAKVKLSQDDYQALIPLVQKGVSPAEAVAQLPALQMQRIAGTMTDEQVAAEIAARTGNRSPKRD